MVAPPSELPLPPGWGHARIDRAAIPGVGTTRSTTHRGEVLTWQPPGAGDWACDIERRDVDLAWIAHRLGLKPGDTAVRAWVVTEVVAKLLDVPILAWLKTYGPIELAPQTNWIRRAGQRVRLTTVTHAGWIAAFGHVSRAP